MAIIFHRLLQMLFLTLVLQLNSVKSQSKRGPECSNSCGNITVPYPFGIEENCYLDPSYRVRCNDINGSVSISGVNVNVVDISLDGQIRALSNVGRVCYNETGKHFMDEKSRTELSRFPLSLDQNELTTFGCDIQSKIKIRKEIKVSCTTVPGRCRHTASCSSNINCCQARIEHALPTQFFFKLVTDRNHAGKKGFTSCAYSFIAEIGRYNFSSYNVYNLTSEKLGAHEMLLDWTVGNTSCQEAQKNITSYLCKENSVCSDSNNALGYRCSCSAGYHGNPYLDNGCQDINECDGHQNDCIHGCANTNGSYKCACPFGQHGDGKKTGKGCTYSKLSIISATATFVVLSLALYGGIRKRKIVKNREKFFKKNGGLILKKLLFESKRSSQMVKIFSAAVLEKAANNFHKTNVIGQGGYGTVYKGTLADKTMVAIKRSKSIDEKQIEQFINEVIMLSEISHPNVVKLLGCCLETETPLLVYEFVTNKTVFQHLHEHDFVSLLTFERRLNIATQTAEAISYIHSTTQIIHRDIKSSNILLTDDYTAKVSDFGISRFIPVDQTHLQTLVHGTLGYIDPEYFRSGILTEKSDVYSFGMVLVELLTGKKVYSHDGTESELGLAMYFVSYMESGCLIGILDAKLKEDGLSDHIKKTAELAKECVELEGKKRPNMKQVKDQLKTISESYLTDSNISNKVKYVDHDQLIFFD